MPSIRLSDSSRQMIRNRLERLSWRLVDHKMNQLPVIPDDIYDTIVTPEVKNALGTLYEHHAGWVSSTSDLLFTLNSHPWIIKVGLPRSKPYPQMSIWTVTRENTPPIPAGSEIGPVLEAFFIDLVNTLKTRKYALNRVHQILRGVNTVGQLKLAMPGIDNLLTSEMRLKVGSTIARCLPPEFELPEHVPETMGWLAKCSMLDEEVENKYRMEIREVD